MVFVQKWPLFQPVFLGEIGKENVFLDILERKDGFLGYKKKKFKKSKNSHFCKAVNPWFWSKNCHFSKVFFLGNIGQENVFYNILGQKHECLGYKNKMIKTRKIEIFPKGLPHGFGPKMAIVSNVFFFNIGQGNVFYDILQRKNSFLGYKNKKFKKSKNWHFSKGVNPWFWSKNGHFSNFFF